MNERHRAAGRRRAAPPEHEVAEEGVALTHSEVVQQRLRHVAGVFEEAGEAGEHLHDLQRRKVVRLLHVLDTGGQTLLLCGVRCEEKRRRNQLLDLNSFTS